MNSGVALTSPTITTGITPTTTDGAALGSTAKMFSDLFLASGGVINFNNGETILTHTSGGSGILTNSGKQVAAGFYTQTGTQSCSNNTATDTVALNSPGFYLCLCYYAANEASNPYFGFAVISTDGTTRSKIHLSNFGTACSITMNNLNMRITQTSGVTLTMNWRILSLL